MSKPLSPQQFHCYAGHDRLYVPLKTSNPSCLASVKAYLTYKHCWMSHNFLQLNPDNSVYPPEPFDSRSHLLLWVYWQCHYCFGNPNPLHYPLCTVHIVHPLLVRRTLLVQSKWNICDTVLSGLRLSVCQIVCGKKKNFITLIPTFF